MQMTYLRDVLHHCVVIKAFIFGTSWLL